MSGNGNIKAYRLVKTKHKNSAFDGQGAKLYGGRWNSKGTPVIYLASSVSLAMLEIMVHLNEYRLLQHYSLFKLTLATDNITRLSPGKLPKNWNAFPAPFETANIGDQWLTKGKTLTLCVPSVVITRESNYLLNTKHPSFKKSVKTAKKIAFTPDVRL